MNQENRKRRVAIVTPPDVRNLTRTPSPKRHRNEGENRHIAKNSYNGDGEHVTSNFIETQASDTEFLEIAATNVMGFRSDSNRDGKKIFNDSIHGHIELHPLFVKIIDTPQLQRLRNIKQLGGCYFVFPGASHHRFEHCIGTCYLAGRLVKSLQKRQPILGITDEDVLCVQTAGLCHDLGHGPFSHMFDSMFIPTVRPNSGWKHETASVNMFDHMVEANNLWPTFVKYNLTQQDMIFIKELIAGQKTHGDDCQEWPYKGRGPEKSYLYEIVANKRTGIDVDKFDYFARDCHCLGISNSFDHKRYMKFARVLRVEGKLQICVRDKEAGNIYDMFHTRNSLFRRAYQHKTSNIIEAMISEAFVKADKHFLLQGSEGKMVSISESIDDMVAYSQLTDHVFYQILYSTDPGLEEARSILRRIQTRDLYKCIGQTILRSHRDKGDIPDIREEIARCNDNEPPVDPDDFVIDLINFDYGMRDRNPIDDVRFYQKDKMDVPMVVRREEPLTFPTKSNKVDKVSNMLPQRFAEQHMRVYFRRTDAESLEKAKRCFLQWCLGKQCTTPKGGDDLAEMTPMKPDQEVTHGVTHGGIKGRLSFS